MVRVRDGDTAVRFDPETARLTVEAAGEQLLAGPVEAEFGGETYPQPSNWTVEETPGGVTVSYEDDAGTTVWLTADDGGVGVRLAVESRGGEPRRLDDLSVLAADETGFGDDTTLYRFGYHSWPPTTTIPYDEQFPEVAEDDVPMMRDMAAAETVSHGLTALIEGDRAVTMGFLDHSDYIARFDFETAADGVAGVDAVCPGDGVAVAPGERRETATLRIDATRPVDDALAVIADGVAERMDARVGDWVPTGWCSWYHYFTEVTADDIRENAADIGEWGVPVDFVQIDDGYQVAFGDWLDLDSGFDDMDGLIDDINAEGMTGGIWLAPFFVQEDAAIVEDHPDWFITDGDGEKVLAGVRHGDMYGLDTTHPEVQDYLTETFETVAHEWGFGYIKMDFLYAAALPGERYADVTRAEAYRQGMATIREAVGDDTFLLACGALQPQSVGYADSMRIGADTAEHWDRGEEPMSEPAHENAVRNVLNREYLHRRWWINDPDCQLIRETTDLTADERRSFAAVVALTGGSNVFSDKVELIEDWAHDLLERTLPPVENGEVIGIGEREYPDQIVTERDTDGGRAIALFNWADGPRTLELELADDERGWDAWEGEPVPAGGSVEREVPAHGSLLVHTTPAADRPHVVGARHLAAAADQLTRTTWTETGDGGRLALDVESRLPMEFVVAVPDGWSHPDGDHVRVEAPDGRTTVAFERE
jgi:alpha-galactosidase